MVNTGLILIGVILIGSLAIAIWFDRWSKNQRKKSLTKRSIQQRTHKTNASPSKNHEPKLSKSIKINNDITSNLVTLITRYSSGRDEFYGTVEVYDGHPSREVAIKDFKRDAELLKRWGFLGFGDRFDAMQRGKDFDDLAKQFNVESQLIISEFREGGWTVEEQPSASSIEKVYHLSR